MHRAAPPRRGRAGPMDLAEAWLARANELRRRFAPEGARVEGLTVISIGALRVGGVGKSLVARATARALEDHGVPTALVLRGYRGRARGPRQVMVTDDPREVGDEALEHVRLGRTVVVARDRVAGAQLAHDRGARCVVLDDGFQHLAIARDLDVVMLARGDATARSLPAGPLRETPAALAGHEVLATLDHGFPGLGPLPVHHCPVGILGLERPGHGVEPIGSHRGAHALLVTGIARPERVASLLEAAGIHVLEHRQYPDHDRLPPEAWRMTSSVDLLLTTGKDAARMAFTARDLPMPLRIIRCDVQLHPVVHDLVVRAGQVGS